MTVTDTQTLTPKKNTAVDHSSIRRVAMIGLGYIGLPTGAVMADSGLEVIGVDINEEAVAEINKGRIHIVEPGLEEVVARNVAAGRLHATLSPEAADAFVIAVPTPVNADHSADMRYVHAAAEAIAPHLSHGNLVVLESTSPIGATEDMLAVLRTARPDLRFPVRGEAGSCDVHVAYCPERVLPGYVLEELVSNDRALGGITPACAAQAAKLYNQFVEGELFETDVRSAELCKLAENAFRDVNIAYANELANVCEKTDIDVWEVIRLANKHPRVNILRPGPGVGGHCIAVDPYFIIEAAPDETPLMQAARHVNSSRPDRVIDIIGRNVDAFKSENGRDPKLGVLGLAFKPDIDDLRESPALTVAGMVNETFGPILAVEPHIQRLPGKTILDGATLVSLDEAVDTADILVLLVNHTQFDQSIRLGNAKNVLNFCSPRKF